MYICSKYWLAVSLITNNQYWQSPHLKSLLVHPYYILYLTKQDFFMSFIIKKSNIWIYEYISILNAWNKQ